MKRLLVDLLPAALWASGNLFCNGRLHFCVGSDHEGMAVRSVEWQGRTVAIGRRRTGRAQRHHDDRPFPMMGRGWTAVRTVFQLTDGFYEERVTLWATPDAAAAIDMAEADAEDYAGEEAEYLGLAQAYVLRQDPRSPGAEVFSFVRTSDLIPDEYLRHYFGAD